MQPQIADLFHDLSELLNIIDSLRLNEVRSRRHLLSQAHYSEGHGISHRRPSRPDKQFRWHLNWVSALLKPLISHPLENVDQLNRVYVIDVL